MATKRTSEEPSDSNLVQIMTISLFIILLAFFILLNSIAVIEETKMQAAISSVNSSFVGLTGGDSLIQGSGDGISPEVYEMDGKENEFSELFTGDEELTKHIKITANNMGSVVRMQSHLLFDQYDTKILPSGYVLLDKLSKIINKNDYPIEITGHTDNAPQEEALLFSKRELSAIRVSILLQYFIEKRNVPAKRLTTFGMGEYRPVASNKNIKTRELNNRIDFVFVHKMQQQKPNGVFTFKDFFFKAFD